MNLDKFLSMYKAATGREWWADNATNMTAHEVKANLELGTPLSDPCSPTMICSVVQMDLLKIGAY